MKTLIVLCIIFLSLQLNARDNIQDTRIALEKLDIRHTEDYLRTTKILHIQYKFIRERTALHALKHLTQLEELVIYQTSGVSGDVLSFLPHLKKLKRLAIVNSGLDNKGLKYVGMLHQLEELDISNNKALRDEDLYELRSLVRLKILGLSFLPLMNGKGLSHLSQMNKLLRLNFSCGNFDDTGMMYLRHFPELKDLDINRTKITDKGMPFIRFLKNLESINFFGNGLTDKGVLYLLTLKKLQVIDLSYVFVSEDTRNKLRQTFPNARLSIGDLGGSRPVNR